MPVASREFSRTEQLIIRFAACAPNGVPRISASLLSRMGQAMRDIPVDRATAPAEQNQMGLPLAGLAPGEYLIELTASSRAGETKDLLEFRVTN